MGQPRASRRRVMTVSSDEDEGSAGEQSEYEEPTKSQKHTTGKLKPTKKVERSQQQIQAEPAQHGSSQKSPGKSRSSKVKGKPAAKDPPKANGKPIYSFFNAATEKQRTSQPSASPEKLSTPQEEPEAIHDDSADDQGSGLQLAKGSSLALAMRKRKVQHSDSFESESGLPSSASQKFRKTSSGERLPSHSIVNEDRRPWTDQFGPNDLSELAVHKRKVADVRQWLQTALNGHRQKVLVLKGAAGTGKTTTIRLLARDLGLKLMEWKNPAGVELTSEGSASAATQFSDFIGRAGKSVGLQFATDNDGIRAIDDEQDSLASQSSLLLVEEFPNTYSSSSSSLQSFRSAILQYLSSPTLSEGTPTPVVMIISETLLSTNTALADSFTAHRLLGPDLANHPFLDMFEFNAVAPTILTKALETTVIKEARKSGRRRTPGPQVLKRLAECGDIRSAVSSLEFLCLRGDDGNTWSSKVSFTKQKRAKTDPPLTNAEEDALKLISNRESTLGIFHAVGKVVYNKRSESQSIAQPPSWLPQHRRNKAPENDVDELIDELGTDTSTFVAALHENYALSCCSSSSEECLDSLVGCVNSISDADLLSVDRFSLGTRAFSGSSTDSLRQDEMAFQVAVRGLLFTLPYPVHRSTPPDGRRGDANLMFYPSSLKLWKRREEIEGVASLVTSKLQADGLMELSDLPKSKAAVGGGGVESWRSNTNMDVTSQEQGIDTGAPGRPNSAKMEMLIERLPYMSQIVNARNGDARLMEQLRTITRIRGIAPVNDTDEAEADDNEESNAEQWATDIPDPESTTKASGTRPGVKQRQVKPTEGGGLGIPVESKVEKLVLEDDDIED